MRPKGRRQAVALKTARLSTRTLDLVNELKQRHPSLQTIDDIVYYYLSLHSAVLSIQEAERLEAQANKPTKEDIIRLTHEDKRVDRIIRGVARRYKK